MLRGFFKPRCLKTMYLVIDISFKSTATYFLYRIYTTLTKSLPIAIPNTNIQLDNLTNSIVLDESLVSSLNNSSDLGVAQEEQTDDDTGIQKSAFLEVGNYLNNSSNEDDDDDDIAVL